MPGSDRLPPWNCKSTWIDTEQSVNPNIEILQEAIDLLGPLAGELVFLGGCATGLLITDPAAPSPRVTMDVDVIVEVGHLLGYYKFCERLKERGFTEYTGPEAPICRWRAERIILDVMPTDSSILGFGNIWFARAFKAAKEVQLPSGSTLRLLPAVYFLATKLEAFDNRGEGDFLLSRDMEDVVAVLDGRPELFNELKAAEKDLRLYLVKRFSDLIGNQNFFDALPGHLPPDAASQARARPIMQLLQRISGELEMPT